MLLMNAMPGGGVGKLIYYPVFFNFVVTSEWLTRMRFITKRNHNIDFDKSYLKNKNNTDIYYF